MPENTFFGGDIGDGKPALKQIVAATKAGSMTEGVRQVMLQLTSEMKRKNIRTFTFSDIQIRSDD